MGYYLSKKTIPYSPTCLRLYHYAGNNPITYTDPNGYASILQRVINNSDDNLKYKAAHYIGLFTEIKHTLHGLVDRGELGGMDKTNSVYQYSGAKSGFTTTDSSRQTNIYVIQYTDMDEELTEQAVHNVLNYDRFGNGNNKKAMELYKIFSNDCNSFLLMRFLRNIKHYGKRILKKSQVAEILYI